MDFPESEFWNFSLAEYGSAGVGSACLRLQDERGLNVNLLLFCAWLGSTGRGVLDEEAWQELVRWTRSWDEQVVLPLRQVRQSLKTEAERLVETLRARVGCCELSAEHLVQLRMEKAAGGRLPRALPAEDALQQVVTNLRAYLGASRVSLAQEDLKSIRAILRAAVPSATTAQLDPALQSLSPP